MKTTIAFVCAGLIFFGCDDNKVLKSEIDKLISSQVKANEDIINEMNSFLEKHGKEGFKGQFELTETFKKMHSNVISFFDSLDTMEDRDISSVSTEFIRETLHLYQISTPQPVLITDTTPRELIKLQIVNIENFVLREYKDGINFRFNNMEAVIIPDKINFESDEPITGTISIMGYSTEMEINAKVNGLDVKGSGKVPFKVDPSSFKDKQKLTVEVLFPNKVYNVSIDLNQK